MKQKIKSLAWIAGLALCTLLLCSCVPNSSGAAFQGEGINTIQVYVNFPTGKARISPWGDGKQYYYFFLPSGTEPSDLTVETANGITFRTPEQEDVDRVTFLNGSSLRNLSTDTVYLLGCYDDNHYLYEFPVIFKSGSNVHSIFINTDTGDITPVLEEKDHRIPGTILITDSEGKLSYQGKLDYIKGRGNGSWYSFKKPFNIKLADAADLLGMGKAKKYCLLSQESDYSMLRNQIGFSLAKAVDIPYSPDSRFADLWIDGMYSGLYLLTDRINISSGSVDIRNLEEETQALNSHKLSTYPIVEVPGMKYSDIPVNPTDLTGGYLMEVDKFYHSDKDAWFNTYYLQSVTMKSPSYCSKMQMDYIHLLMQEIESMFFFHTDDTLYRTYIDEDSWVRMGLLQEIIANTDFMGSSQYFYKEPDVNGKRSLVFAGPVWDLDQSMAPRTGSYLPSNSLLMGSQIWYMQLLENPYFRDALLASYQEDFRPRIEALLDHEIDDMAAQIRQSADMNFLRWENVLAPEGLPQGVSLHGQATEEVKEYLTLRTAFLDDYLQHPETYHEFKYTRDRSTIKDPAYYYWRTCMVKDGETMEELRPSSTKEGKEFVRWRVGNPSEPGAPFSFDHPIVNDMTIYAEYRDLPNP